MANEAVAWQFRCSIGPHREPSEPLPAEADWHLWVDCPKATYQKIRDGLRTGWRSPNDIQVRALGVVTEE